jgi:hypothetical protein
MYEQLFEELVAGQRKKLMVCARRIISYITEDDLLQPNDFPELENNPLFRYEEGVLEGLLTAQMALRAEDNSHRCKKEEMQRRLGAQKI